MLLNESAVIAKIDELNQTHNNINEFDAINLIRDLLTDELIQVVRRQRESELLQEHTPDE